MARSKAAASSQIGRDLKTADLYENRDLKPTTDLRAVLKGVLKDHLRADDRVLAQTVFPGGESVRAMTGLVA